jgi:hypothetical protein
VALIAVPVAAQEGPIRRSVRQYGERHHPTRATTQMHSPLLFWAGAALVAGGTIAIVAAQTWAQESDLSLEDPNTRLGRDLAPCGTDPTRTRQPVADCKTNVGLQVFGILTSAGGGALMVYGGQRVQIVSVSPRRVAFRVRW